MSCGSVQTSFEQVQLKKVNIFNTVQQQNATVFVDRCRDGSTVVGSGSLCVCLCLFRYTFVSARAPVCIGILVKLNYQKGTDEGLFLTCC